MAKTPPHSQYCANVENIHFWLRKLDAFRGKMALRSHLRGGTMVAVGVRRNILVEEV